MSDEIGINLSANDATAQFKLGTIFTNIGTTGPSKTYKYVQYSNGLAVDAIAGNVVYHEQVDTGSPNTLIGCRVTMDLSESDNLGAGVLQAALTDLYYGWIQVRGIATLTTAITAGGTDGAALTAVGSTDGTLAVTAAATSPVVAYAIDASAKIVMCSFPH